MCIRDSLIALSTITDTAAGSEALIAIIVLPDSNNIGPIHSIIADIDHIANVYLAPSPDFAVAAGSEAHL